MKERVISILVLMTLFAGSLAGCGKAQVTGTEPALTDESGATAGSQTSEQTDEAPSEINDTDETSDTVAAEDAAPASDTDAAPVSDTDAVTPNGEIYILCTSDVHCGVDQGFGYAGLYEIRKSLEAQGYTTILVDDGDNIQGEAMGTLSEGQISLELMNAVGYDVAIPGNHEFDYGMARFLELADQAQFKYISCNFNREGELIFDPYTIVEACGHKIAFVGVTTPETLTSSTPTNFQDEKGDYIYGFMQDDNGEGVYNAVQEAVDAARAEGADYVYVMGHMGLEETARPWTYADVISHTNGIDVFLDGHSHDTEQVVMKNKDGKDVVRCAVGTKMRHIGYSHITDKGIEDTGIWTWPNNIDAPTMLNIQNPIRDEVNVKMAQIQDILDQPVAESLVELTIYDPVEKDTLGNPIRMVRRAETNLGDLCADALRIYCGTDIGMINGGGVRDGIHKGKITYGDLLKVYPWSNSICILEVTGQQLLDVLEWGARGVPEENGAFMQVSGMSFEIDSTLPDPCTEDTDHMMTGISGKRRIRNVMVGDKPIDPAAKYTVAGSNYGMLKHGDGQTGFDGAEIISSEFCVDNKALAEYITENLGGVIGEEYADLYGQGRITIIE